MRIKSRHTVGFLCAEMYTSTMLKNLSFKQVLFAVLGVLLTVLTFTDMPQSIEFACWMFGLAFTSSFQKFFSRFPAIWAFFMVGFGVGLLTELGAILGSLSIPAGERVLLAQDLLWAPDAYVGMASSSLFIRTKGNIFYNRTLGTSH